MTPLEPTDIATDSESQIQGRVLDFLDNVQLQPSKGWQADRYPYPGGVSW